MSIFEFEEELFRRWKQHRNDFVSDGVVEEASYLISNPKMMFVLKEVNSPKGGGWDLRQFLRDGARSATWDNITRWIIGINRLDEDIAWNELQTISEEQRVASLKSICAINLKKSPGGHTTDTNALEDAATTDKDYLNEQFSFYNADLVICCGVSSLFHRLITFGKHPEWRMTNRGIWFHEYKKGKYVISYSHPEARVQDYFLYYGLIDAIREIFQNRN